MNFWKGLWLALPALLHFAFFFFPPSLQVTVKQFFAILRGGGGSRSWCHVRQLCVNAELGERSMQTVGLEKMNVQLCGMNESIRDGGRQVAAHGPLRGGRGPLGLLSAPPAGEELSRPSPTSSETFPCFCKQDWCFFPPLPRPLDFIDWNPWVYFSLFVCFATLTCEQGGALCALAHLMLTQHHSLSPEQFCLKDGKSSHLISEAVFQDTSSV